MTRLTGTRTPAGPTAPALPQALPGAQKRSLTEVQADPRVRLGAGTAALLLTAMAVRRDRVSPCEAEVFRACQGPARLALPARLGHHATGDPRCRPRGCRSRLAGSRRCAGGPGLVSGAGTWALSKLVKQIVRRPRLVIPLLSPTRCRGSDAAGLGYLSGHAGVAVALGAAALPHLGPVGRALTLSAIPVVGLTRVYVGAHLPLDIAGGAALGLVVDTTVGLVKARTGHASGTLRSRP